MPDDPKGYSGSDDFQTKDLECLLDHYTIDEDGNLLVNKCEVEYIEGDPKAKSFAERFGHVNTKREWTEAVQIDGIIELYDFIQSSNTDYDYSISYNVHLTSGKVERIELSKFETFENAERKKRDKEFIETLKTRRAFENTLRYKFLYKYINITIQFVCATMANFGTTIKNISWKISNACRI